VLRGFINSRAVLSFAAILLLLNLLGDTLPGEPRWTRGSAEAAQRTDPRNQDAPLQLRATLVQVPVVVTDRAGKFIPGLAANDFTVLENGKPQQVSSFATVKQPFNVVLVLDTSNSAPERLKAIQHAALGFLTQIRPEDRVMAISFDHEVRRLTDFTSDRNDVESAIRGIESGFGKLLYEAMAEALKQLKGVEGRRAVILFSDGVDLGSIDVAAESTTRTAEAIGAVVYVVHLDTRWWIEAEARRQAANRKQSKLPFSVDVRIPLPPDYGGPDSTPTGMPRVRAPRIEIGASRPPQAQGPPQDEITTTLDKLYGDADAYLDAVSARTAGRVFRPESYDETLSAFAVIAEELRNQYLLTYYAGPPRRDESYRRIKVEVTRKGVVVRARPGYRMGP